MLRGKLDDRFHVQFARLHKISWCEMFLPCRIALNHGVEKKILSTEEKEMHFIEKRVIFYFYQSANGVMRKSKYFDS